MCWGSAGMVSKTADRRTRLLDHQKIASEKRCYVCVGITLMCFLPHEMRLIAGRRVTRNKGLSVRQYYELVGDTFDLRSKWDTAVTDAGLDAVRLCVARSCVRAGAGGGPASLFARATGARLAPRFGSPSSHPIV